MGTRRWMACAVLGCGLLAACEDKRPKVQLLSFAPTEASFDAQQALTWVFDRPVVSDKAVGEPADASWLQIRPKASVALHWHDRQTLVLKPKRPWAEGTAYTLALGRRFPVALPEDAEMQRFVHAPLQLQGLRGAELNWFPLQGTFRARFSQPVGTAAAARRCRFVEVDGPQIVALESAADRSEALREVPLRPVEALAAGKNYKLDCDGLMPAEGNAAIARHLNNEVTALKVAGLEKLSLAEGARVTPDELELRVNFRTPVDLDAFQAAIRLEPPVPGFRDRWVQRGATAFRAELNLEASASYRLVLDGKLQDRFGQRVGDELTRRFETTDARPRLHMEKGIYAVEAQGAGYPVWSRSVSTFELSCAYVPKRRLTQLLTGGMDYDPWYAAGKEEGVDWQELRLRKRSHTVKVDAAKNKWKLHDLDLPKLCGTGKRGVYLAEVRSQDVEAAQDKGWWQYPYRVLANVTDFGALLKVGPSSGLLWLTRLSDAQPVAGAAVTVYTPQGRRVHRGATDAQGLLQLPGSDVLLRKRRPGDRDDAAGWEEMDSYRSQRLIVVAEHEGDLAVVDGNWANGIQTWNFGVPQDFSSRGATALRGMLLSDRGIYRPGETVHFKGFVRALREGMPPSLPDAKRVELILEGPRGAELSRRQVPLSRFGGFSLSHSLSEAAAVGDYLLRARVGPKNFVERFAVEAFRPVSFEIKDETARDKLPDLGERVNLRFRASYLFGEPLKQAEAEYSVRKRRHVLRFKDYPGYSFEDWGSDGYGWYGHTSDTSTTYVTDGSSRTDKQGKLKLRFRDKPQGTPRATDYLVRVAVTDAADQQVSKQSVVTLHPTNRYLGLHTQEWVQAVNMPFAVNAVALTPQGKRVAADATLRYLKRKRHCKRGQSPWGYYDCETQLKEVWSRPLKLSEGGAQTEKIAPKEPGTFVIRLEGKDGEGRALASSQTVWVIGEGEAFWSGDESARMSLVASRAKYKVGETARLVPQADVAESTALITLERGGVRSARIVKLAAGVPAIDVPLEDGHAPNVFVSVAAVRGRRDESFAGRPRFHLGISNLEVSPDRQRLKVTVRSEKASYEPGEQVRGELEVRDAAGQPVQAEVALSVADEGVLQLINYRTPDPMAIFYKPWGLAVDNSTNWNRIARQRPPQNWDEDETGADGGTGAKGEQLRSRFVSSAYWNPALLTDAQGIARFSFVAPDNLTAFRLMASAADAGARFGRGKARITLRKDLMAAAHLPRFLNVGDRVELGATLHNYSGATGWAAVRLRAKGLAFEKSARKVRLKAGASRPVLFWATVEDRVAPITLRLAASMKVGERQVEDGFERELPVRKPVVRDAELLAEGRLEGGKAQSVALAWGPDVLPARSHLELSVDTTGLASLEPSLRALIGYPYGCLEQTLSKLIPLFKVKDLAQSLGLEGLAKQSKLRDFIRLGVDKVLRHQHGDGHFSLWPSSEAYPHLTAYALWGLSEAREAGVKIEARATRRARKALKRWANRAARRSETGGALASQAMAAYALQAWGEADAGLNARLFEKRAALPRYGQVYLLRALAPGASRRTLADELRAATVQDEGRATLSEATYESWYFASEARTTSLWLSALLEQAPKDPLILPLVAGLKQLRGPRGGWGTTQRNLYALVALADYARSQEASGGPVTLRASASSETLFAGDLAKTPVATFQRPLSALKAGTLRLEAARPTYFTLRRVTARLPGAGDVVSEGFRVSRSYVDEASGAALEEAKVGQLIRVRLRVEADALRERVALVDPIPAGVEVVNLKLATEARATRTRSYGWVHTELRDDRAAAFATRLRGKRSFEYLVRATRAGRFAVPSAQVEAMYAPELRARTPAMTLTIAR